MKAPTEPHVAEPVALFTRLRHKLLMWSLKALVAFHLMRLLRKTKSRPADRKPTYTKTYPGLPGPVRVFVPPTYKTGDAPLPLFIDIHGGGFCIGAPLVDDRDNLILSRDHGICVVSIPYRMAPIHQFPTAPQDCAALITAILADDSLPVDRTKVAVGGYSAGGNLSLGSMLCLAPEVRANIKGIAAYYPAVNFIPNISEKAVRQTLAPNGRDVLHFLGPAFSYCYVPRGTDLRDPRLSPIFARREDLPPKISLLGCEYDVLCPEARDMAEDLATLEPGQRVPLEEGRNGWTKGGVRFELIEGERHGFNSNPAKGAEAERLLKSTQKMHAGIAEWLKREVYS